MNTVMKFQFYIKCEEFREKLRGFSRRTCYTDLFRQLIPQPLQAATTTATAVSAAAAATTNAHINFVEHSHKGLHIVSYL